MINYLWRYKVATVTQKQRKKELITVIVLDTPTAAQSGCLHVVMLHPPLKSFFLFWTGKSCFMLRNTVMCKHSQFNVSGLLFFLVSVCWWSFFCVLSVLAGSEKYLALEHCKSMVVLMDVSLKSNLNIHEQTHAKLLRCLTKGWRESYKTPCCGVVSEPG